MGKRVHSMVSRPAGWLRFTQEGIPSEGEKADCGLAVPCEGSEGGDFSPR